MNIPVTHGNESCYTITSSHEAITQAQQRGFRVTQRGKTIKIKPMMTHG